MHRPWVAAADLDAVAGASGRFHTSRDNRVRPGHRCDRSGVPGRSPGALIVASGSPASAFCATSMPWRTSVGVANAEPSDLHGGATWSSTGCRNKRMGAHPSAALMQLQAPQPRPPAAKQARPQGDCPHPRRRHPRPVTRCRGALGARRRTSRPPGRRLAGGDPRSPSGAPSRTVSLESTAAVIKIDENPRRRLMPRQAQRARWHMPGVSGDTVISGPLVHRGARRTAVAAVGSSPCLEPTARPSTTRPPPDDDRGMSRAAGDRLGHRARARRRRRHHRRRLVPRPSTFRDHRQAVARRRLTRIPSCQDRFMGRRGRSHCFLERWHDWQAVERPVGDVLRWVLIDDLRIGPKVVRRSRGRGCGRCGAPAARWPAGCLCR